MLFAGFQQRKGQIIETESTFVTICAACTRRKREKEVGERCSHLLTKQTVQERQKYLNPESSASVGEHSTSTPPNSSEDKNVQELYHEDTSSTSDGAAVRRATVRRKTERRIAPM